MQTEPDFNAIHIPVMRQRCLELLAPALQEEGAIYVDGTTGMGGHSEAVLSSCPNARAICIDRDTEALGIARRRLAPFGDRVEFVHDISDRIDEIVADRGVQASAILFDLGVSSLQLDETDRGFSYSHDAPLDMRMDQTSGVSAAEIVNTYSAQQLRAIFHRYGDEPHARAYAESIVADRAQQPFVTTGQLVATLEHAIKRPEHRGHPAKRVFQALRIEVNEELKVLERAVPAAIRALRPGGRIVVMSFQSLEDRIVKRALRRGSTTSAPLDMPVEREQDRPILRLLTKGAEQADERERSTNPRSLSVRLRAAEKLREATA